jgi:PKHD-type hydroxylase
MDKGGAWSFETDEVELWAYADKIFTKEECKKIILQNVELYKGTVLGNEINENIRKNYVNFIHPSKDNYWIFERLASIICALNKQYFNFDLFGLIEGLQFSKYEAPGGFYGAHIDKYYKGIIRKLSITVQLSDPQDYEGGDLLLHLDKDPQKTPKEIGKLIAFPSYTLHEVTPVTKGTRYSLVAWVSGKSFK